MHRPLAGGGAVSALRCPTCGAPPGKECTEDQIAVLQHQARTEAGGRLQALHNRMSAIFGFATAASIPETYRRDDIYRPGEIVVLGQRSSFKVGRVVGYSRTGKLRVQSWSTVAKSWSGTILIAVADVTRPSKDLSKRHAYVVKLARAHGAKP